MSTLTKRHEIFVKSYRATHNATQSAIAAGYSEKTAGAAGSRLLKHVKVAAALNIQHQEIVKKLDCDAERVVLELARCGFSDPRRFFKENGSLKAIHELDDDAAAALASVEVDEIYEPRGDGSRELVGYTRKVKFWSKPDSLNMLGKYRKLFGADQPRGVMVEVEVGDARAKLVARLAG